MIRYIRIGAGRMAKTSSKIDASSLPEFFRDLVRDALERQRMHSPEAVEFYLVNLLKDCASAETLRGEPPEGFREEPLATIYFRAIQARHEVRIALLRRVGDLSLFISGFFPESVERQLVNISYYIQMGENAYGALSQILARRPASVEVFGELARRFMGYVDILTEVSERSTFKRDLGLLKIYEKWLRTGSRHAARLLSEKGILPVPGSSLKVQ